jgi:hypothetical protein
MRQKLALLAVLAAAAPARAEDAPMIHPSRDVAVEYRSNGMAQGPADPSAVVTMRFTGKGSRVRIDGPNGHGYAILDVDGGRMTMVMTEKQIYMEQPANPAMLGMFQAKGSAFRKTGTDTVAGVPCTTYTATINDRDGQVCLTGDGVMLRARSEEAGRTHELEAVKVTYADQPAALFEPPAGFKKLDMADMAGRRPISGFGSPNAPRGSYMGEQNGR